VKYKEQPLLLHNLGNAVLEDVSSKAGTAFSQSYLARGLAIGDWDNDGAPDAIFTCVGDRPVLLRNNVGQKTHGSACGWKASKAIGTQSERN